MKPTLTFHQHLRELRLRLLYVFITLGITGSISYILRKPIINFIQKPLHSTLYFTSPAGSFNFIIKIATVLGVFLALPIIVYNLIRFIEPALPKTFKSKNIYKVCASSFVLAVAGIAFGYYVIVPMSLHFFLSYSSATVRPLITANEYISFIANILITFALIFQIPLIVLFINFVKPLNPRSMLRYQKYIVIASLIIAVLLPFTYDPISQFVLALPILMCFYFSVLLVKIVNRKKTFSTEDQVVTKADVIPEAVIAPTPSLPDVATVAAIEEKPVDDPVPKSKKAIYVDGFLNNKPANPLVGFKTFDILPIAEYRARNSITKNKNKNLSIDGFTFAS